MSWNSEVSGYFCAGDNATKIGDKLAAAINGKIDDGLGGKYKVTNATGTLTFEASKEAVAQQMESAVRNATLKKDDEINNLKDRISWRDKMLGMFTKILMQSNGTFRKAVDSIINFAKDTYRSIFSREEAKTIKSVMEAFGKNKEDYRAIGTFLVFTADKKENLSNSEYRKAVREVDDVAIGRYEQAQKRGNSLKL